MARPGGGRLHHVAQRALQGGRAVDHQRHGGPGSLGASTGPLAPRNTRAPRGTLCPTCDDVLYGPVLALVHGPVLFSLPLPQLCDQLLLLLLLLVGLDLEAHEAE